MASGRSLLRMKAGPTAAADQRGWLQVFLDVRTEVLVEPAAPQHAVNWPSTVERIRILAALLRSGADNLSAPLAFLRPWIAIALYVAIAMIWFIPDRRIESMV